MKNTHVLTTSLVFMMLVSSCGSSEQGNKIATPVYPETKTIDHTDTYFGVEVADPYRWLEDDNAPETEAWVKEQNAVTYDYLGKIPFKAAIKDRLTKLWNYSKESVPSKKGERWFFSANEGLQNQAVMYVKDSETAEARVLLDPNKLSTDGTVALSGASISRDGKYLAYMISDAGSDWNIAHVLNVETGEKLSDEIRWIKFSGISWYKNGFYYSRYDEPTGNMLSAKNEFHKVYYHKVGTPQSDDKLVFVDSKNPLRNCRAGVSDDEQYLFISQSQSTDGEVIYIKNLTKNVEQKQLNTTFEYSFRPVDVVDGKVLLLTNYQAPNYQLISVDADNPKLDAAVCIIPEDKKSVLKGVDFVGGKLFATYMTDAHNNVQIYNVKGEHQGELKLPAIGTFSGLSGGSKDEIAYFSFNSFTFPSVNYRYNVAKNEYTESFKSKLDIDLNGYETKQVFFTSKDGTKVPMFITHKKGITLNGNNPTILYGYGGFNISRLPGFSVSQMVWMENGGVYAVANIRGGGEYGKAWHDAGTKLQKQNVFDDFIAAGEYLVAEKYTSPKKLAVQGGSNGGLLVGAVVNQRPDLFAVGIPQVGVLDMLRFQKFTIGWAWTGDYGSSEDSKEMFEYLYKYSPLHNISNSVNYPAVMVMTGDHDDRVVPAHSFKYAAELQKQQTGKPKPMLIRIQTRAGHGAGKPTSLAIEEQADIFAFILQNMGETYQVK